MDQALEKWRTRVRAEKEEFTSLTGWQPVIRRVVLGRGCRWVGVGLALENTTMDPRNDSRALIAFDPAAIGLGVTSGDRVAVQIHPTAARLRFRLAAAGDEGEKPKLRWRTNSAQRVLQFYQRLPDVAGDAPMAQAVWAAVDGWIELAVPYLRPEWRAARSANERLKVLREFTPERGGGGD